MYIVVKAASSQTGINAAGMLNLIKYKQFIIILYNALIQVTSSSTAIVPCSTYYT